MNDSIEEQPIEVKALENFLLYIKFKNNEEKIYDVLKLLDIDIKNTTTRVADDFYYDIGFTKEMLNDLRFKEE